MTDSHNRKTNDSAADLDLLFAAAQSVDTTPDTAFLSRLVATAEAMQPAAPPATRVSHPPMKRRGIFAAIGGWPALGGFIAATAVGVWLGISPPTDLSVLTAQISGQVMEIGLYGEAEILALLED